MTEKGCICVEYRMSFALLLPTYSLLHHNLTLVNANVRQNGPLHSVRVCWGGGPKVEESQWDTGNFVFRMCKCHLYILDILDSIYCVCESPPQGPFCSSENPQDIPRTFIFSKKGLFWRQNFYGFMVKRLPPPPYKFIEKGWYYQVVPLPNFLLSSRMSDVCPLRLQKKEGPFLIMFFFKVVRIERLETSFWPFFLKNTLQTNLLSRSRFMCLYNVVEPLLKRIVRHHH